MRLRPWMWLAPTMFAVAWGGNEFTPLLVMYRHVDGFDQVSVNLLLSAYVVGIVPALLLGGPLSDRWGRRPLMLPAAPLAILGSAVLALGAGQLPVLFIGRVISGIALGLVMAVGSSWIKELSEPPFESGVVQGTGARRASLSLTAGFGLGAAVAAALAQYAPLQTVMPYLVNIVICLPAAFLATKAPETRFPAETPGPLVDDLKIPAARQRRFLMLVAPSAPWVFGCAASGYAILPALIAPIIGEQQIAFSGLLCLIALSAGFAIQPLGKRLDKEGSTRALVIGMIAVAAGMAMAMVASATLSVAIVCVAAVVLGCGYGLVLIAGLQEIQRIAGPNDLAGLTAVFYSLTYLGFFIPMVLAVISQWTTYPWLFAAGVVIALASIIIIYSGRNAPFGDTEEEAAERAQSYEVLEARTRGIAVIDDHEEPDEPETTAR